MFPAATCIAAAAPGILTCGWERPRPSIELSRWTMNDDSSRSPNVDRGRLTLLIEQFRRASSATAADRAARAQLLDELQELVGLSNKMSTETDIIRRAEKLLR
jgi:hypothetical protein